MEVPPLHTPAEREPWKGKTENPAVNGDSTINDQPLRLRDGISRDVDLNQQC
jgi:hypothetical protein